MTLGQFSAIASRCCRARLRTNCAMPAARTPSDPTVPNSTSSPFDSHALAPSTLCTMFP